MTKKFLGSPKKKLRKDGFTVTLYELSDELYSTDTFNVGVIPNLVILSDDKTKTPLTFAEPSKIEFLKDGTDFDYFTEIKLENGNLFATTFGCLRYKLDIPSGKLYFSEQLK